MDLFDLALSRTLPASRFRLRDGLALGTWLAAAAACLGLLAVYSQTPGVDAVAPREWPEVALQRDGDVTTLVLFAHPHCPCTRASMSELERLVARARGEIRGHVVFFRPSDVPEDWVRTDLWKGVERLPGFESVIDTDGELAAVFGAGTSGTLVLYDRDGRLVFQGGSTSARGHEGASRGSDAILHGLATGEWVETRVPAYGCPLFEAPVSTPGVDA